MPFFTDRGHYHAVVAVLLGGDVQARVVGNDKFTGIEVALDDGRRIVWTNQGPPDGDLVKHWVFSVVDDDGTLLPGTSARTIDALPDDVALTIATYDYSSLGSK